MMCELSRTEFALAVFIAVGERKSRQHVIGMVETVGADDLLDVGRAAENGMEVLDPAGQAFNPEHHQAISQGESEGVAPGHVITVFQKGYLLTGRLLRRSL